MVTAQYTPPVSRALANENCSMRGSKIAMQAGLEPRGVDAVEHLRVGEFRLEDLLDDVLVRRAELRLVVDAGARFLVHVVAGFGGHDHADLGGRRHDRAAWAVRPRAAPRPPRSHRASAPAPRSEGRVAQMRRRFTRCYSFTDAARLTEHVDLHRAARAADRETHEGALRCHRTWPALEQKSAD